MADPPRFSDAGNHTGLGPDRESTVGTPRWVKIFGVIAIVVFLLFVGQLFVGQLLVGGGRHGPSRHVTPEAGR